MRGFILFLLFTIVVLVKCDHLFIGTSIKRPVLLSRNQSFPAIPLQRRVENLCYVIPKVSKDAVQYIQGILAYELTLSGAQVKVTKGGLASYFVNLQLESDIGHEMTYEICIYG